MPGTELKRLEELIGKDIPNLIQMDCKVCEALLTDFRRALKEEAERIKLSMSRRIASVERKKELRKYVREQQQNLIMLNTYLLNHANPEKLAASSVVPEAAALCHYIYKTLDDLLSFMERHFIGYFDLDTWIPTNYRLIVIQEIREDLETLEQVMLSKSIDKKLVEIVFLAFTQLIQSELEDEITYRKVRYLKKLKNELFRIFNTDHESSDTSESVKQLLIRLNFNCMPFVNYSTNEIKVRLQNLETLVEKREHLAHSLKEINQIRDRTGFVLDIRLPSLKEQVSMWIVEELDCQVTAQQLPISFPETVKTILEKIELNLSVAQLAALIWAGVKEGLIKNKNVSAVFRAVVAMVNTKKTDEISFGSLKTKYQDIEQGTRDALIKILQSLIDRLRSHS